MGLRQVLPVQTTMTSGESAMLNRPTWAMPPSLTNAFPNQLKLHATRQIGSHKHEKPETIAKG